VTAQAAVSLQPPFSQTKAVPAAPAYANRQHVGADTKAHQRRRGSSSLHDGPKQFVFLPRVEAACYGQHKLQLGKVRESKLFPREGSSLSNVLLLSSPTVQRGWTFFLPPPLVTRHGDSGQEVDDNLGHGAGGVSVAPSKKKKFPSKICCCVLYILLI